MTYLNRSEPIGDEIVARMARCTVAQGAETDLGVAVYRGRQAIVDDMIPCSVLIEAEDEPSPTKPSRTTDYKITQGYVLLAYVPCDPDHPNAAAHAAIRDMKRAVFGDGHDLGGRVREMRYRGKDIGPRADGKPFVVAAIEVAAEFAEDVSAP